ncbi:MAG: MBL fold metallo-hydrolase [Deltaproteobacteria bacterium]|nr:MBL fold metallo-hydrolase [Deltaproteobacteria bacterium]MBW1950501.1 MBL fold metallo-hydrolase [Deltaproteobacteria bacterium]MBW2009440.1 MBL fold metallo-hydrolase [Deltaproteobacteria bacterium]
MKIKFWGTRGSIAVPGKDTTIYGGNTTCLEITLASERKVIVDAGTGIRALGDVLTSEREVVDLHLLITHIHWDHVLGFPFFAPIYNPSTRIIIDGFPTCMKGLRYTFDNKMGDGFFPIQFDDLRARIKYLDRINRGPLDLDGVLVDTIPLQHPQGGFGFRFREGEKTFIFLTDNELRDDAWTGRSPQDYAEFCRDADILVHDAQYTPEEIADRRGWGHSDYLSVVRLALEANVKRLILFHHDPSRKDVQVMAMKVLCDDFVRKEGATLVVEAAMENSEFDL